MKSTAILDLMIQDHNRLMEYLEDVENNFGRDFGFLSNSFNTFQWGLEKHFFVEERAIFASYNPDDPDKEYNYFSDLMDQHTVILEKIELLRKKLQKREPFDLNEKKNFSRCWELFNCSEQLRENCEAYYSNKRECWLLNNLRGGPRSSNNGDCIECKWLKRNIGNYNIKYLF